MVNCVLGKSQGSSSVTNVISVGVGYFWTKSNGLVFMCRNIDFLRTTRKIKIFICPICIFEIAFINKLQRYANN